MTRPSYSLARYPLPAEAARDCPARYKRRVANDPADLPPPAGRREWIRAAVVAVVAAVAAGLPTGLLVAHAERAKETSRVAFSVNRSVFSRPGNVPAVAERALGSVVTIETVSPSCSTNPLDRGAASEAAATGMIVSPSGEILTNNHVVAGATSITVQLPGVRGRRRATVVGSDPAEDLALIRVVGRYRLRAVHLDTTAPVRVGESVVAVGNALALSALSPSVTAGIISGNRRTVTASGECAGRERLSGLLQTQAAINPGDSGGPLLDMAGEVVGMNTAGARTAGNGERAQNVGFAIPVRHLVSALPGLEKGGTAGAPQGFLGVRVESLTPLLRRESGAIPTDGALVAGVEAGSPALMAGLMVNDVIVEFAGQTITSAASLVHAVQETTPGSSVSLVLWRGQHEMTLRVFVTSTPAPLD